MALPVTPPIKPMLAKLQTDIPTGPEWVYEPKWDGFRAIVFRDKDSVHIASRDHKPLERYFPELVPALQDCLPDKVVVDGEVIVAGPDGLDFGTLQQRIHPAESRINMLSKQTPAGFVAFDALAMGRKDLRKLSLTERRAALLQILPDGDGIPKFKKATQIHTTPQSDSEEEAQVWLETLEKIGLDGIIAKRLDTQYVEGQRVMVKVKQRRTADCVVGGYRLSKAGDGIGSLLLGLYDDEGTLQFVGHTSSFKAAERREILAMLKPLEGEGGFGWGRTPGTPSRWSSGKDLDWRGIKPQLVVEVSYDKMQGDRMRHAATFIRWRDDKKPEECTTDQVYE